MITIWHNPRCSKSRQTLALLTERGLEPEVRLYLKDPPSVAEIRSVLIKLGCAPADLVRFGEKTAKELGISKSSDADTLIDAMANRAILIERPVVIVDDSAALGRPPEAVLDIL